MKKQIAYLKKNYHIIDLATVEKIVSGKRFVNKPSIVLTFDDGYKDIMQLRYFLKKQNIKPALFLIADTQNVNTAEIGKEHTYLNKNDIKSLIADGWEVGCHSNTHANLSGLSEKELYKEIVVSKKTLEESFGIKINYFAYPRGKYSKTVLKYVKKAKYKLGLTMDDNLIDKNINPLVIPRIGIDRTHTFSEFKSAFSPSTVGARMLLKNTFIGRYI